MKIFNVQQLKEWDRQTIERQKITSWQLMERAAKACFDYLFHHFRKKSFVVFCGPGNNGGDGLALARMLRVAGLPVNVYTCWSDDTKVSKDNLANQLFWSELGGKLEPWKVLPDSSNTNVVFIDAILGTGQNRPLSGIFKEIVDRMNGSGKEIIAIDLPTGLYNTCHSDKEPVIKASLTLSFEVARLPFFMPENESFLGDTKVLPIGLDRTYEEKTFSNEEITNHDWYINSQKNRPRFSHKGTFGTALLIAGKKGMTGAAFLASKACLRTGAGKLVVHTPASCAAILQSAIPEAIVESDSHDEFISLLPENISGYRVIAIGPGIGKMPETKIVLHSILLRKPQCLLLDADALNIIAEENWQALIPQFSVLTPHLGEFDRLWGKCSDHFERLQKARKAAEELSCYIVVKGANSAVVTPEKKIYFNATGNNGLAKAGTGDVLTGIVAGMIAQGYAVADAIRRAVYLHGYTADNLAVQRETYSFLASDLVENIGIRKM